MKINSKPHATTKNERKPCRFSLVSSLSLQGAPPASGLAYGTQRFGGFLLSQKLGVRLQYAKRWELLSYKRGYAPLVPARRSAMFRHAGVDSPHRGVAPDRQGLSSSIVTALHPTLRRFYDVGISIAFHNARRKRRDIRDDNSIYYRTRSVRRHEPEYARNREGEYRYLLMSEREGVRCTRG